MTPLSLNLSLRAGWVVALCVLSAPALMAFADSRECRRGCCKRTDTRMVIKNLEAALVHFQSENVDSCPRSIAEMVEQRILAKEPLDAWGQPLRFVCPGVHNPDGADIVSAGRDRLFGTADDIQSWER